MDTSGHDHMVRALNALDAAYKAGQGDEADVSTVATLSRLAVTESNLYLADAIFHLRDHLETLPARLGNGGKAGATHTTYSVHIDIGNDVPASILIEIAAQLGLDALPLDASGQGVVSVAGTSQSDAEERVNQALYTGGYWDWVQTG